MQNQSHPNEMQDRQRIKNEFTFTKINRKKSFILRRQKNLWNTRLELKPWKMLLNNPLSLSVLSESNNCANIIPIMSGVHKMVKHTLKIFQNLLQHSSTCVWPFCWQQAGHILDINCVRLPNTGPFCKKYAKLYFLMQHI